jgi:predicted amidohydrolase YtcJ
MKLSLKEHDTIFYNARVLTMDPACPVAGLVAVKGDWISAVAQDASPGSPADHECIRIDCRGKVLLPGFVDAHCHLAAYAESLVSLDLSPGSGVRSVTDIQDKIRNFCVRAPEGSWIRGKGYNEFHLAGNRHPDRRDLDAAAPGHPVKLTHRSGHAHVLNSRALESVGIRADSGDPPGGMIDRDLDTGRPTGVLFGMGGYLAGKIPPLEEAEMERGLRTANSKLLSYGVTSIQDASASNGPRQWKRFQSWKSRKLFLPRVTMLLGVDYFPESDKTSYPSLLDPSDLRLGGVKILADRVTGSLRPSQEDLNGILAAVHGAGFQAAIHALEEPVVEAAVDAIGRAVRQRPRPDSRHRVEHCSVCRPDLLGKLAGFGGMIVTQPAFLFYEGDRYLKTVPPDELENLYPVDAMIDSGVRVGFSSDCPIADPNPLVSLYAAVARRSNSGNPLPRRGVDLHQAIKMHTLDAAAASFEEGMKGSISPGKLADFVLLDEDPFVVAPDRIREIRPVMTVLGGRIVWKADF